MLRIVDRYIIREVLPPFVITLLVFTFTLELQPLQTVGEKLIARGVSWSIIAQVMATLLPQALAVTIPMALLMGLLVGLGRLSADREWVALQACGVSPYRLLWPIGLLGVVAWAATSYVIIVWKPAANQTFREITYNVVASRAETEVKPRVFFEDFPNVVIYVRDVRAGVGWTDVFVADSTQANKTAIYLAERGRMAIDRARRRVDMVLQAGTIHNAQAAQPDAYEMQSFRELVLRLDPETVFPRTAPLKGDSEMTIAELKTRLAELERQKLSLAGPWMEIHQKFSIPVACLVFALIGLALGVSSRRDSKLASFVLGVAIIFLYYVIMWTGRSLAMSGLVPSGIAMWAPNVVLGAAGVLLLSRTARSGDQPIRIVLPLSRPGTATAGGGAKPGGDRRGGRVVVVIRVPHLTIPQPHILDRYVARQYLAVFGLAFVGLLGIFYISTFIDLSDKMFRGQATPGMLLRYFYFATPQFMYYIIPIAGLIATLVTIGLLTKNSELIVMKACGISLYRAAAPALVFAVLASGLLFVFEEQVLAIANRRAEALRAQIRGFSPQTFDVLNRKWMLGKGGSIYHYVYLDPRRNELNGLSIYDFDPVAWRLARRTFVTQAVYTSVASPTGYIWRGQRGWLREFGPPPRIRNLITFTERLLPLEPVSYFRTEEPDAARMTYSQLKQYIGELRASGFEVVSYMVALHRKLSFPLVTVIMTLIAVPFAVTTGRRGALYGIGVGIVLAMVYWTTMSVFAAIGSGGAIAPGLAAWAPNILFGAGAAYLLLTVRT